MKIDEKTASRLATLGSIELSDAERKSLVADLNKIAEQISKLEQLETTGVEPTYEATGVANVWREDLVEKQPPREELLKMAPNRTKMAVKVPKIL